jgi:hypothetical protein
VVAAATGDPAAAAALYDALGPYDDRLVVWGGAVAASGPVSHYLGLLAVRLGRLDDAVGHLQAAVDLQERIGALPGLAHSLAALADALETRGNPGDARSASDQRRRAHLIAERLGMPVLLERLARPADEWTLGRDGDDWLLEAGAERARLRDGRGLHYLRALLAAPGRDIPALDLAAAWPPWTPSWTRPTGPGTSSGPSRPTPNARPCWASCAGPAAWAAPPRRRPSAPGQRHPHPASHHRQDRPGRPLMRRPPGASIHTGRACRYQPAPGGPSRWHV